MSDRKCLNCHEQLRGRADQKFCSNQCRSTYNNQQYIESNSLIRTINRILKKNHFILTTLNAEGKTSIGRSALIEMGYRFDYFTSTSTSRNNRINYFCYDQGYRESENNKVILVRREMNKELAELNV